MRFCWRTVGGQLETCYGAATVRSRTNGRQAGTEGHMSSLSRLKFDIEQAHRVDGDRVAARSGATELLGALDGVFDPLADFTAVVAAQDVGFDWNGLAMSERL